MSPAPALDELDDLIEQLLAAAQPPAVRESARLLVLDTVGCALAGMQAPPVRAFIEHAARFDPGPIPWPGLPATRGLSVHGAAQVLAMAACWDEACEGLAYAHGRPGVPVVAAVLALASSTGCTWHQALDALVVGYEIGGRMGNRLRIKPGMHVDAGWPALGAAAAAACLMGGDGRAVRAAVEIAAAQLPFGLYLPIAQGADGRNTYLGHAASLGIYAAAAAAAGVCAPRGAVDEHAQVALSLGPAGVLAPVGRWLLLEGYLKRWPAVRHVHYGIAAAQAIRMQWPGLGQALLEPGQVGPILLRAYPEALTYCGIRAPRTPIQAQFSLSFGVSVALRFGDLEPQAYRDPIFSDPGVRELERRVELQPDAELGAAGQRAVVLEVRDAQGRSMAVRVDTVEGDPGHPLARAAVRSKFIRCAGLLMPAPRAVDAADSRHGPWAEADVALHAWWRFLAGEGDAGPSP
jgi:2-methylcitrate dehydratase PrpD